MPHCYQIGCDACGFVQDFFIGGNYRYRLDDGFAIPVPVMSAWCAQCNRIVNAERVPPVDALLIQEQRSAKVWEELKRGMKATTLAAIHQVEQGIREEWRRSVQWRLGRNSPPHCLACGSAELTPLKCFEWVEETIESMPHPGCSGRLRAEWTGHVTLADSFEEYNSEGARIGQVEETVSQVEWTEAECKERDEMMRIIEEHQSNPPEANDQNPE